VLVYAYEPDVNQECKKTSSSRCTIQASVLRLGIARISYQGLERIKNTLMVVLNGIIEYYFSYDIYTNCTTSYDYKNI
jgi:hypothetical protein